MSFDLVLRGGALYDGSGRAGELGDLAITHDRIAAVGEVSGPAEREIRGVFRDGGHAGLHRHQDAFGFYLPINPKAESKVRQGVTTEVIGHCGFSVAPVLARQGGTAARLSLPKRTLAIVPRAEFRPISRQLSRDRGKAAMLVGHDTLRLMVMGMDNRVPTAKNSRRCAIFWKKVFVRARLGYLPDYSPHPVRTQRRRR